MDDGGLNVITGAIVGAARFAKDEIGGGDLALEFKASFPQLEFTFAEIQFPASMGLILLSGQDFRRGGDEWTGWVRGSQEREDVLKQLALARREEELTIPGVTDGAVPQKGGALVPIVFFLEPSELSRMNAETETLGRRPGEFFDHLGSRDGFEPSRKLFFLVVGEG